MGRAKHAKPAEKSAGVERLAFIEGFRGLAALYVMVSHFGSMADPALYANWHSASPAWFRALLTPLMFGHLAVAGFIVVSGFCLQMALFGSRDGHLRNVRRFFVRRARRILPPYYACLGISLVVCLLVTQHQKGLPFSQYLPLTPANVMAHVLMVHNFHPDWMYKINGVLWSIAIEVQLYLLFPLLVWLKHRTGRPLFAIVATAIPLGVLAAFPGSIKLYPWYLALFGFGMVAAHYAYRPNLRVGIQPVAAWVIGSVALAASLYACTIRGPMVARDFGIGIAAAAGLYLGAVSPTSLVARFLGNRLIVWIGAFSYSLYLMHHPILQVVYALRPAGVQSEIQLFGYFLVVATPVIVLFSWLFALVFERPFMRANYAETPPAEIEPPLLLPLRVLGNETLTVEPWPVRSKPSGVPSGRTSPSRGYWG